MIKQGNAILNRAVVAGLFLSMLAGSQPLAAKGPGTAGAEYLTLPVGAKSIAMGEVQSPAIGEPLGWLSNPAVLSCMEGKGFGAFHAEWLMDTRYDNAAYHQRINEKVSVAVGFVALYRPDIQGYDQDGAPTKSLDNSNYRAVIGLGYAPVKSFAAGIAIKYFNEKLDEWSAGGVGFDIGALYTVSRANLSFGLVAQNVGPGIKFESLEEPLPTTIRGGASQSVAMHGGDLAVTVAVEAVKPRYENVYMNAGCELLLLKTLGVRAGYNGRENRPGNGLTLGCGAAVKNVSIDYAWTSYDDLGAVHRITLYFMLR